MLLRLPRRLTRLTNMLKRLVKTSSRRDRSNRRSRLYGAGFRDIPVPFLSRGERPLQPTILLLREKYNTIYTFITLYVPRIYRLRVGLF